MIKLLEDKSRGTITFDGPQNTSTLKEFDRLMVKKNYQLHDDVVGMVLFENENQAYPAKITKLLKDNGFHKAMYELFFYDDKQTRNSRSAFVYSAMEYHYLHQVGEGNRVNPPGCSGFFTLEAKFPPNYEQGENETLPYAAFGRQYYFSLGDGLLYQEATDAGKLLYNQDGVLQTEDFVLDNLLKNFRYDLSSKKWLTKDSEEQEWVAADTKKKRRKDNLLAGKGTKKAKLDMRSKESAAACPIGSGSSPQDIKKNDGVILDIKALELALATATDTFQNAKKVASSAQTAFEIADNAATSAEETANLAKKAARTAKKAKQAAEGAKQDAEDALKAAEAQKE